MSGTQLTMPSDGAITAPSTSPTSDLVGQLIGLDRQSDRANPCCRNRAIIGSSKGPHGASLICDDCGRFRGWLSAEAVAFIAETRARFGAPEMITLRSSTFGEDQMARDARSNNMTGALFKNEKKREGKQDADYTGSAVIEGRDHWVDAWLNTSQKTGQKYLSLRFKPKNAATNDLP